MTFDHGPINELIGSQNRRHRGHLVDNDLGRRRIAQHRQQYDRRIVAATPVDGGFSTLGNEVRITSAAGLSGLANSNRPSLLVLVWASWLGSPALAAPKGDGRIRKRPPSHLALSLDTNGGRDRAAWAAKPAKCQQNGGYFRLVDLEHVLLRVRLLQKVTNCQNEQSGRAIRWTRGIIGR
jgi:hypothetical protein